MAINRRLRRQYGSALVVEDLEVLKDGQTALGVPGKKGPAGGDAYAAILSSEAHTVACDEFGTPVSGELGSSGKAKTNAVALRGAQSLSAVSGTPGAGQFKATASLLSGTATFAWEDDDTLYVGSISTDTAVIRVSFDCEGILTLVKDYTLTKAKQGASGGPPGPAGADATAYWLVTSTPVIRLSSTGALLTTSITVQAYSKTGADAPAAYAGRFKIYEDTTLKYTSSANESVKSYTLGSGFSKVKVELYLADGVTNLLDWEEIPCVLDGTDGYTVNLSNDVHTVICDASSTALSGELGTSGRARSTLSVYRGGTLLAAVPAASVPGGGQYRYVIEAVENCTAGRISDTEFYVDTVSNEQGSVTLRLDIEGTDRVVRKVFRWVMAMSGGIDFVTIDGGDYDGSAASVLMDLEGGDYPVTAYFVAPDTSVDGGTFLDGEV